MNTFLKLIAMLLAAGYPAAVFLEVAGVPSFAALDAETVLAVFAATFATLIVIADYSRRPRKLVPHELQHLRPASLPPFSRASVHRPARRAELTPV